MGVGQLIVGADRNLGEDYDRAILDALGVLVKQLAAADQVIASDFGVTRTDLVALVKIDGALPMKELAQRMGCDASFVTAVADALERHGLASREPDARDRRVKNLVLTAEGIAARERLIRQLGARLPWRTRLNHAERADLLGLLRKLTGPGRVP